MEDGASERCPRRLTALPAQLSLASRSSTPMTANTGAESRPASIQGCIWRGETDHSPSLARARLRRIAASGGCDPPCSCSHFSSPQLTAAPVSTTPRSPDTTSMHARLLRMPIWYLDRRFSQMACVIRSCGVYFGTDDHGQLGGRQPVSDMGIVRLSLVHSAGSRDRQVGCRWPLSGSDRRQSCAPVVLCPPTVSLISFSGCFCALSSAIAPRSPTRPKTTT